MDVPKPQPIAPTDPRLQAAAASANNDQINALMTQASGDTAALMARYGTRLALAGQAGGSPLTMAAVAPLLGKAA